jgi:hypothetical protein
MCSVNFDGNSYNLSEFSVTITNPIIPIYTANLDIPKTLRVGIQEVTGSVSSYEAGVSGQQIRFSLGDNTYIINVVFSGPEDAASTGPFINTVSFNGTNDGPVWIQ